MWKRQHDEPSIAEEDDIVIDLRERLEPYGGAVEAWRPRSRTRPRAKTDTGESTWATPTDWLVARDG